MFFNSPMYNAGATCTDCHSTRMVRPNGTRYTSHWFASPLKLMEGFTGDTIAGDPVAIAAQNPCQKCHATDTIDQSRQRILDQQDRFFLVQERTQLALVNALKYIDEQGSGIDPAHIAAYQRASMRWEYYTQAENSMGFHNHPEAMTEVANARLWVDQFIPWPLTPVKVRVTSEGATSLTLTFFDQANDEQGFRIERAAALEGPYDEIADLATPNGVLVGDVSFTDAGLSAGSTYFYRVSAYNTQGQSVPSIWAQASTLTTTLAAPTGLAATAVSATQINLTWADNSTDETGFRVERATNNTFTAGLASFDLAAGTTSFSNSGLLPETTYYYRVFAVGAAGGISSPSNTASATTLAAPPNAPSNLAVTGVTQTSVALRWNDNSANETGFYLERCLGSCTSGSTGWARIATPGANTTSYTDPGLARKTTYSYRVQAHNGTGASSYSNIVKAKTR